MSMSGRGSSLSPDPGSRVSSDSGATRASLLQRARMRDESAWCELVELYSPMILGWCRKCRASVDVTADCVQEVFASVSRSLADFHFSGTPGAFRGWLWIIVRNKLRDLVRREARHARSEGGSSALVKLAEIIDPNSIPDEEPSDADALRSLNQRGLLQIRDSFEPQTWRAFTRCVVDGLPTDMVAQELNTTSASVRQSRSRVLRRLRQQLGDAT